MPAPESEMRQKAKELLGEITDEFDGFDVDLVVGVYAAAYAKGLEDAAKIAEQYLDRQNPNGEFVSTAAVNMCWREIASQIRSRIKDQGKA